MAGDRHPASALLGVAGLILATVAGGALLPGAARVATPDMTITSTAPAADPPTPATGQPPVTGTTVTAGPQTGSTGASPGPAATSNAATSDRGAGSRMRRSESHLHGPPGESSVAATATSPATEKDSAPPSTAIPAIAPSPARHLTIPAIHVDADVLPVDSRPTGQRNRWGGMIYQQIDFPVDPYVRQWVRRGDPNSLPAVESASNAKAFDRVVLYGHASDIGYHLVFQDLSALRPGQAIIVRTSLGSFTYRVATVVTRAKADLAGLPALYDYPKHGAKEIALVACLPDTTSNVVVIGTLTAARPAGR